MHGDFSCENGLIEKVYRYTVWASIRRFTAWGFGVKSYRVGLFADTELFEDHIEDVLGGGFSNDIPKAVQG